MAIVSSVGVDGSDDPVVNWQRTGSGSARRHQRDRQRGRRGHPARRSRHRAGETIIAAEVFYSFTPLFGIGLAPRVIHRVSYYKPRLGSLESLLP